MEILISNWFDNFDTLYNKHFEGKFPLPSLANTTDAHDIIGSDGKVIASGVIKLLAEAIIVTDQSAPKKSRVKAIDILLANMLVWCGANKVEQVHAFVEAPFDKTLIKRYGFEKVDAIPLVLNLG
jgi:hypothetical protein